LAKKQSKLLLVEWQDTVTIGDWYGNLEEIKPSAVEVVGWLVRDTKDFIVLSSMRNLDGLHGSICCIPKGCIVTHKELKNEPV